MERINPKRSINPVKENLLCSICGELPLVCKMCTECQQVFCDICGKSAECGKCKKVPTLVNLPGFMFEKIEVYCKYKEAGCDKILFLKDLKSHEDQCDKKPLESEGKVDEFYLQLEKEISSLKVEEEKVQKAQNQGKQMLESHEQQISEFLKEQKAHQVEMKKLGERVKALEKE